MTNSNYDFLRTLQELQSGIMSDELIELAYGRMTLSEKDSSVYFNNVLIDAELLPTEIDDAEKLFAKKKKRPTFYFENAKDFDDFKELLSARGYNKSFEDCWLFHSGKNVDKKDFNQVQKVVNDEDLEVYLETLNNSFCKDDPHNPYGELGEYIDVAREKWKALQGTGRLEYFVAFAGERPVSVGALTSYKNHGYISNIGSLMDVRGQGFGKLITHYCVQQSVERGNTYHYLSTEEGSLPFIFYLHVGFEEHFKAVGWSKSQDERDE